MPKLGPDLKQNDNSNNNDDHLTENLSRATSPMFTYRNYATDHLPSSHENEISQKEHFVQTQTRQS